MNALKCEKRFLYDLKTIALLSILACICCLAGCGKSIAGDWVFHEIKRVQSSDGQFDAVILTGDAGATTRATTVVRVVKAGVKIGGEKPAEYEIVFWATDVKNLVVVWKQPKLVDICFDEASIDLFKNHNEIQRSPNIWDVIEVRLRPASPDFSLPQRDR
jgi:hypothetical protein